jgi:hypothetical protein
MRISSALKCPLSGSRRAKRLIQNSPALLGKHPEMVAHCADFQTQIRGGFARERLMGCYGAALDSWLPARRAAQLDPMIAVQDE